MKVLSIVIAKEEQLKQAHTSLFNTGLQMRDQLADEAGLVVDKVTEMEADWGKAEISNWRHSLQSYANWR